MSKDNKNIKNTTNNEEDCETLDRNEENQPVENNQAAAWAGIQKQKSDGKVPIPDMGNVEDAKEWVEENKK